MSQIILFHHAQGLTNGIVAFADNLRGAGHIVHTPDMFGGRTFDDIDSGVAFAQEIGFENILDQGVAFAESQPTAMVYAGFSMGVMPAQKLAQTRDGALGALFFDSCLPTSEFGEWPNNLPVQIHGSVDDEWFSEDLEFARQLADSESSAELFLYSGARHLFADSALEAYDEEATAILMARVHSFLESLA